MLLPALQKAKEQGRRARCIGNLKQIGVALQNHQSQFGSLPQDGQNGYGYGAFLLPAVDQQPLYELLNPLGTTLPSPAQARPGLEDAILAVFRCPSFVAAWLRRGGSAACRIESWG